MSAVTVKPPIGATASLAFGGAHYRIHVDLDAEGFTRIRFLSSNPPPGLNETIYEFYGRLPDRRDDDGACHSEARS